MSVNAREKTHLQPQCRALANRGQLRGLKVREAQRGQVTILTRENGKAVNHDRQLLEYEGQSGADENKVRVAAKRSVLGILGKGGRTHSVT